MSNPLVSAVNTTLDGAAQQALQAQAEYLFVEILLLALAGGVLTALVRWYALKRNVLDQPGERSSHKVPTPRGGGVSFVLLLPVVLFWFGWQYAALDAIAPAATALVMGTWGLALVGWFDDHQPLSARLRFAAQAVLAFAGLLLLPQWPELHLPLPEGWSLGWQSVFWLPLWLLVLLWLTNLYNFMDGINGLAGLQAVSVLLGVAFLLRISADPYYPLLLLLAAPLLGFLYWNFPKAHIFMGDVGSAPLGLLFGLLAFWLSSVTVVNLWCWLILLSVFIVDASWTLAVRVLTGQRWAQPHRSHTYQILARYFDSHTPVSLYVMVINLSWLLPWAAMAMLWPQWGALCWLAAASPLIWLCYRVKAGMPES